MGDQFGEADKQLYLSLTDHDVQHKVRELNANRIGQLVRITGQVPYIDRYIKSFFSALWNRNRNRRNRRNRNFLTSGTGTVTVTC